MNQYMPNSLTETPGRLVQTEQGTSPMLPLVLDLLIETNGLLRSTCVSNVLPNSDKDLQSDTEFGSVYWED